MTPAATKNPLTSLTRLYAYTQTPIHTTRQPMRVRMLPTFPLTHDTKNAPGIESN